MGHFRLTHPGAYYLRKSWKVYELLVQLVKDTDDKKLQGRIKFGVGIFHFGTYSASSDMFLVISLIPPTFAWIAEVIGFHADREKALVEMEYARTSGCVRGTQ